MAENINDGEATDRLRPEIREAVETVDAWAAALPKEYTKGSPWEIIRAELERQAAEIAELRAKSADRDSYDLTDCMREMCVELADAGVIPSGLAPMFVVDAVLALAAERDELRAKLDNPGTTHIEGCWTWGPKHYGCAENRIKELEAELAAMRAMLEGAPTAFVSNKHSNGVPDSIFPTGELPADWWGKRVRLVVEVE